MPIRGPLQHSLMVRSPARLFSRDALSQMGPLDRFEPFPYVGNSLRWYGFHGIQLEVQEAVFPKLVLGKLCYPTDRLGYLSTIHAIVDLGKKERACDVDHPRGLQWPVATSFGRQFFEVCKPAFEAQQGMHDQEACLVELHLNRKLLNFAGLGPDDGSKEVHHQQALASAQECERRTRCRIKISSELKIDIRWCAKPIA